MQLAKDATEARRGAVTGLSLPFARLQMKALRGQKSMWGFLQKSACRENLHLLVSCDQSSV